MVCLNKQARDRGNPESSHLKTSYITAPDTKTQILQKICFSFKKFDISVVPCLICIYWNKGCPDYTKDPRPWVMEIVGIKFFS